MSQNATKPLQPPLTSPTYHVLFLALFVVTSEILLCLPLPAFDKRPKEPHTATRNKESFKTIPNTICFWVLPAQ